MTISRNLSDLANQVDSSGTLGVGGGGTGLTTPGSSGNVLTSNGTSWTSSAPAAGGDVVGPSSATDNAIARFDTTTGKLIQNSAVTIDDTGNLTLAANTTPTLFIGNSSLSTGASVIEMGAGRTGSGYAYIDMVGDTTYTDYALRIIRNNTGANASSQILHRGTGALTLTTQEAGAITLNTTNTERMRVTTNGGISFGSSGTAYGTSGQLLQSNGDAAPTWVTAPGMTLLGTITTTSGNSVNLGSLTLTGYKALYISFVGVSCNTASTIVYISSDNSQTYSVGTFTTAASAYNGTVWLDLASGAYSSIIVAPAVTGLSNVTTATTTLYFRCNSTNAFDAGSINVYGVS